MSACTSTSVFGTICRNSAALLPMFAPRLKRGRNEVCSSRPLRARRTAPHSRFKYSAVLRFIFDGHSGAVFPVAPHDLCTGIAPALSGIRNDEAEAVAVDDYRCFVLHRVFRCEPANHAVRIASIQGSQPVEHLERRSMFGNSIRRKLLADQRDGPIGPLDISPGPCGLHQ